MGAAERPDLLARERDRDAAGTRVRFPWTPGLRALLWVPLAGIAWRLGESLPTPFGVDRTVQAIVFVPAAFAICGFVASQLLKRRAPRNPDGSVRYEFRTEPVPVVVVRKEIRRIPWPPWRERAVLVEDADGERTVHYADAASFDDLAPPRAGVATLAHHRLLDWRPLDAPEHA